MSRLIIKNLPKKISSDRLKSIFSSKGEVTDVQLKYNSAGKFRQFAFIGFKCDDEAQSAREFFHDTYIDSYKVKIETCESIGSTAVKAWSKKNTDANIVESSNDEESKKKKKKKKKKEAEKAIPEELENDPKFAEFLSLHKSKTTWSDSGLLKSKNTPLSDTEDKSDDGGEEDGDEDSNESTKGNTNNEIQNNKPTPKVTSEVKGQPASKKKFEFDDSCTVKMKDLPRGYKKSQVKKFFAPLKIISLRCPRKVKGGIAYVRFRTDRDFRQALNKHRGFLDGHRISVIKYTAKLPVKPYKDLSNSQEDSEADPLVETGRIFVRNLCYNATEEEIENHFKTFGPITEVHLPLDKFTQKTKGFAFVTFVFPEHAVKAFSNLDGSSFQGRTLHLLPAKTRKTAEGEEIDDDESTSFKKKKETKLKASSGSWHNWNTLFLGANAVADVMAQKYNTTKSKILDADSRSSVAVTMALGETQIVSETREFLVSQGVHLEAFQDPQCERSKTIILVKNLPANTKEYQIREVFSVHGHIHRLVLPPSGVTSLVEFQHPTEAKLAFRKLAYSKFQHVPLYLEWAPVNALSAGKPVSDPAESNKGKTADEKDNDDLESSRNTQDEVEEGIEEVLEMGTVLFVKNLNFDTTEDSLKTHFKSCGKVASVTIAKKPDSKNPGHQLSMGYGFVQFKKKNYAEKALKELQKSSLDGHTLELKVSNRDTLTPQGGRKVTKAGEQKGTKILVRNIPFEATKKEIREIFSVFGELKAVRLPSKVTGQHRGFGFVDYLTRHDAKRAMASLGGSTHVFGRRLVLEWAETDDTENVDALRKKTAKHFENQTHQQGTGRKRLKDSFPEDPSDLSS